MIKIQKPLAKVTAKKVFEDCVNNYSEKHRDKYKVYLGQVEEASNLYDDLMPHRFEELLKQYPFLDEEDANNLKRVYEYQFRDKRVGEYYDSIMANASWCPFCDDGWIANVDHFLPQSEFPLLVVTPNNLVPSCRDCNMEKNDYNPQKLDDLPLHPYYDDVSEEWLNVDIVFNPDRTACISFYNSFKSDDVMSKRLDVHLDAHKLKDRFAKKALYSINCIKAQHKQLAMIGEDELVEDLKSRKESAEAVDINSSTAALYRGLLRISADYYNWLISQ